MVSTTESMGRAQQRTAVTSRPRETAAGTLFRQVDRRLPAGAIVLLLGALMGAHTHVLAEERQGKDAIPGDWLGHVEKEIADAEYRINWQPQTLLDDLDVAYHAPNRAHGFRTYFTAQGIRVIPRTEEVPDWAWSLRLANVGCAGAMAPVRAASLGADDNRINYDRGTVLEWYVNDSQGLEQGFTLQAKPEACSNTVNTGPNEVVIELALGGTLSAFPSADGQAIDFATPQGVRVIHYTGLHVTDATGRALLAHMEGFSEAGSRGIRLVFEDAGAVYPVTVDPLATSPSWTAESDQAGASFGVSVATAGDVNDDGYSDVIIGAYLFDAGSTNEGRAFVYLGSASGLATSPNWTAEGNQTSAFFGFSVASAGDVNGDGFSDVIVGAYGYNDPDADEGRARVYLGSASGVSPSPSWSAHGNQAGAFFGVSVATAGDVDGDGYSDVIVGAMFYDNGQADEGRAFVYHGSSSGLSTTPDWTTESNVLGAELGISVATAGDVNADGYSDVIVGADRWGVSLEGGAFVYHGSSTGLATSPAQTLGGGQAGALYGNSVATAGDVNGDGYSDVIVAAYHYHSGQNEEGSAYLYLGSTSGTALNPDWAVESNQVGAQFGISVATAGDVNGDGYADVVVGARRHDGAPSQIDQGQAHVYLGSAAGLAPDASWIRSSGQGGAEFGISVATAGDVNGDGYSDLIVGASLYDNSEADEGRAYVYLGSASGLTTGSGWTEEGSQDTAFFGHSVATAGDVDGDGFSDVVVGAYRFDNGEADEGRAYLFRGSALGLTTTASWTAEGNVPGAFFGRTVSTAGDVNGDGYSDVIVGAHNLANGQPNEGRALLYLGSASGLATAAAWIQEGEATSAQFAYSVSTAGDVNGDGYSDVIVGAYNVTNGQPSEGRALVYHGSVSGLSTTAAWTVEGNQDGANLGSSVSTAGDVNRDGYSDVIVGAPGWENDQVDEGGAFLYLGSPSGLSATAAWSSEGNQESAYLGRSVATAGDVNGDGYADVIIGAYGYDVGSDLDRGRTLVFLGSAFGLDTNVAWIGLGENADDYYGYSVATAGDVNGDGYSDLLVGAYGYESGPTQVNEGAAYLYLGSSAGPGTTATWKSEGQDTAAFFGGSVAAAGDVNGDGYPDVVVGAPNYYTISLDQAGRVDVYYGGGGDGLDRIPRQARTDGTTPIALLGKSDSETELRLRALGRTPAGRGRVRLQWEVKPLGTPFAGTGIGGSTATDTGLPDASGSATDLNELVAGLSEGTFYHWRLRTASPDPFFPRSPWMSLAGNNVTETKLRTAGCIDRDGDGYGALADPSCLGLTPDCNESASSIWGTPGPTANLLFSSKTNFGWSAPPSPGALVSSLFYDVLRSGIASDFSSASAICLETDDSNTTAVDGATPSLGQVFFYLARAQNSCPQGTGSLGTTSSGLPRAGRSCP